MNHRLNIKTFLNNSCFKRRRTNVMKLCCLGFASTFVLMCLNSPPQTMNIQSEEEQKQKAIDSFLEQRYYTPSEDVLIPLNHSFIITNKQICQQDQPYLIGIIPSRIEDFRERRAIRKTYGSISRDKVAIVNGVRIKHIVRFVFIVGKSDDTSVDLKIRKENEQHKDMVQVNMIDSYYNLTLKVLMALKWVDTFCPNVKYVLKVDDDVFIHIGLLLNQIHSIPHSSYGNIFGKVLHDNTSYFVIRSNSKWAVSKEEFPLKKYPIYIQGTSYTMTRDLVPKIIQKAQYLPYLHIEDVFITGVIARQIIGAQLEPLNKTSIWAWIDPVPCMFAEDNTLAHSLMTPDLMYQTWRALQENKIFCKLFRGRQSVLANSDTYNSS